jgi:AraC family transcriptional regulator
MAACEETSSTPERYRVRFARVLAHIEARSEDALSIDELADIAAFSRHHFHRQFSGFLGMSAYRYVQFMRMRRASWRLAFRPELSVNEIALATGYEGPEAFARAFRQYTGQSPSGFRTAPDWVEWHSRFRPFIHLRQTHMNTLPAPGPVRVTFFPATRVAKLEHRGSVLRLGDSIRQFVEWRKAHRLPPHVAATFNIIHNDPDETPPEEFRFDLCAATDIEIEPNDAGGRGVRDPCRTLRSAAACGLGRSARPFDHASLRELAADERRGAARRATVHAACEVFPGCAGRRGRDGYLSTIGLIARRIRLRRNACRRRDAFFDERTNFRYCVAIHFAR